MTHVDFTEERFEIGCENASKWKYIRAWITDVSPILITAVIDLQAAIKRYIADRNGHSNPPRRQQAPVNYPIASVQ